MGSVSFNELVFVFNISKPGETSMGSASSGAGVSGLPLSIVDLSTAVVVSGIAGLLFATGAASPAWGAGITAAVVATATAAVAAFGGG